ncbi:F-box protein At3g07870-like isoform X2 [Andrographis paniculata]|uniref:F-box protein At3g07870-like isoform X2 n=1 Tax=Andrographis paniculata TaxID=175694 RepID=UPI0021E761F5|nr:F-box protein At3g07870-like isoform X2 [Andrographis paniculata]
MTSLFPSSSAEKKTLIPKPSMDSLIKKQKLYPSSINPFYKLPHETIVEILSRLPIRSVIQFTFTCKTLYPLSADPLLVKLHLSRSENSYLIIHSKNPLKTHLYFLQLSDQKVYEFETPFASSMSEFSIIGSSNGLLYLIDSLFPQHTYLYNPFTREYFEIPIKHENCGQIVIHGFGFDPVGCDYKVVKIAYCRDRYTYHVKDEYQGHIRPLPSIIEVYSLRRNSWTYNGIVPYILETWSSPGVLVNNRLHWVTVWVKKPNWQCHKRLIVSYNLVDDTIDEMACPCSNSNYIFDRLIISHLAVLDKRLCASLPMLDRDAFDVWVMREYGVDESWVKEYSICINFPWSLIRHIEPPHHIWQNRFGKNMVKVLGILESGEVILEYVGERLVAYDPCNKSSKELKYNGMPRIYQAMFHIGSLVSPHLDKSGTDTNEAEHETP